MDKFVDREAELDYLQTEYTRRGSALVVLYGRRRVGKTTLLTEFMRGKPALYFLATEENEAQNRTAFKNSVADFCGSELLRSAAVDSWELIFRALVEKKRPEKLLLVLDEFQYIGRSNAAFPSVFQKIWDSILKDENIMVILCGSLISMMESQTLNYTSPLYGRRTGQIRLTQIPFRYYSEFFPDKSRRELVEFSAVTGGVPKYIELFHDADDVYAAIERNVLQRSSFLYDEPNFLLQNEVAEVGSYFSIIKAIAAGNRKLGSIASVLEQKQSNLSKYLKTLIDLDILEREVPVTEEAPEKSKRGLYKIKDNFLLFWFRFVYPNLSFIESGHSELAMKKIRDGFLTSHVGFCYEDICLERLWQLNAEGACGFTFDRAGRWWNGNTEIDIVAYAGGGSDILFGECKFWNEKVGTNVLYALEVKAKAVDWHRGSRREHYALFSVSGFTDELRALAETRGDILLSD